MAVLMPGVAQADAVGSPGRVGADCYGATQCGNANSKTWVWDGDTQWDVAIDADLNNAPPGSTATARVYVDDKPTDAAVTVTNEDPAGSWYAKVPGGGKIDVHMKMNGPGQGDLLTAVRWGGE